jgi:sugar phosphate isomerase/epimerase
MIDRRHVLIGGAAALALSSPGACAEPSARERLGVTTVGFRERFASTAQDPAAADLDLLHWPSFVRDTFDIPYAELWSRHFDDVSIDACKILRRAADDVGVKIINIQLDPFPEDDVDMAEADQATRLADVETVMRWMDRSKACGAPFLRANTDKPTPGRPFDLAVIADSFHRLAEYGQTIGVTILVENHTGYSQDVSNVEAVVKAVDHPFCRALPDWGNSFGDTTEDRIASLAPLEPLAALVSAKGKSFDETTWEHKDYDIAKMTEAFERAGYDGVYSVELYDVPAPSDPVAAAKSVIASIVQGIEEARS